MNSPKIPQNIAQTREIWDVFQFFGETIPRDTKSALFWDSSQILTFCKWISMDSIDGKLCFGNACAICPQ